MGRARVEMVKWWSDGDLDALAWLLEHRVQYSGTRRLGGAVGAYGEYLVWREFGGTRHPQSSGLGDVAPARGRRAIEVKTTCSATSGWNLGYEPRRYDFALLRVDVNDWRVVEAWFVPMPVGRRHVRGQRHRLAARGDWQRERHTNGST